MSNYLYHGTFFRYDNVNLNKKHKFLFPWDMCSNEMRHNIGWGLMYKDKDRTLQQESIQQ